MSGKGETFRNASGKISCVIVRKAGTEIQGTVIDGAGTQQHVNMDRIEAEKLHEQLSKVLGKKYMGRGD